MKKQYEAVIDVMKGNGGYSTLGHLYHKVLRVPGVEWRTKTPFASIRRIVQDPRFFFKIRPGLWALQEYKDKLPKEIYSQSKIPSSEITELNHSYYQGLLVEIGNLKQFETAVPAQDKNRKYLNNSLGEVATLKETPEFTYPHLMSKVRTVDVVWFNSRRMPDSFFEVEHSTQIQNSLLKFVELQDFHSKFIIVANKVRYTEFRSKLALTAFQSITERTKFIDYDQVTRWHTKSFELVATENSLHL